MNEHFNENKNKYVWINDDSVDTIFKYPGKTMLWCTGGNYDRFTGIGMDIIDETIDTVIDNRDKKLGDFFDESLAADLEFFEFKNWIKYEDEPQSSCRTKVFGDREKNIPAHLALELTDKCNLACKHCYRDAGTAGRFMPREKLFDAIDRAAARGLSIVELTGGEVTLHPDFCEITDHVCRKMDVVAVLTNGYYYNDSIIDCFLRNKDKLLINISIDSSYPEYHDEFRGRKGAWIRSCNLVRRLASEGLLVRVAMSITPENMFDLEKTADMVRDMGVRSFAFEMTSGFGRGSGIDWASVSPEDMRRYIKLSNHVNKKYMDMLTLVPAKMCRLMNNREINCGAGWRTFAVDPEGNMRYCVNTPTGMVCLGNFLDDTQDEKAAEIISRSSRTPVPTFYKCSKCERYMYCQGCLLKGIIASKDFDECTWEGKELGKYCTVESSPYEGVCKKTILG